MCLVFSPLKCTHFWMANKYKIKLRISLPVRMDDYDGEAFWNPMLTPRFNSFGAYVWSSYQVLGYNRCKHNLVSRARSLLNSLLFLANTFLSSSLSFFQCVQLKERGLAGIHWRILQEWQQETDSHVSQLNDIMAFYGSSQWWNKCVMQLHQYVLMKLHFY